MKQFFIIFCLFGCVNKDTFFEYDFDKEGCIQSIFSRIDYNPKKIELTDSSLYILGDTTFSDGLEANNTLLNYLEYKIFMDNNKCGYSKIVVKYNKTEYISPLSHQNILKKDKKYWDYIEQLLKNIDMYDCVYYNLTSKMVKQATNFSFDGDIWTLISKLSEGDKNAYNSFFAFYNWSKVKYSDKLEFNRTKLNWFITELGHTPQEINDYFIDSIYKQQGYSGFFR